MSNYELQVLVNNRPIKKFFHKNNYFVEGRKGSEYTLELTNNTSQRVEMVVSVDGLSVTDGQQCTPDTYGYIVNARSKIVIKGWRLNDQKVAAFKFNDQDRSYTNSIGNGTRNTGVIGVMVFKEKFGTPVQVTPIQNHYHYHYDKPGSWQNPNWNIPLWNGNPWYGNASVGSSSSVNVSQTELYNGIPRTLKSAQVNNVSTQSAAPSADATSIAPGGSGGHTLFGDGGNTIFNNSFETFGSTVQSDSVELFNIGTEFGRETEFKVDQVQFYRDNHDTPTDIVQLFYDTRKGLESRGIQVTNNSKQAVEALPSAFTGYNSPGCKPPKNWKR